MSQQTQVTKISVPIAPNGDGYYISATTAPKSLVFKPGAVFPNGGPVRQNVYNTAGFPLLQGVLRGAGLFPAVPLPSSLVEVDDSANGDIWNCTADVDFGQNCTLSGITNQTTGAQSSFVTSDHTVDGLIGLNNIVFEVAGVQTTTVMPSQFDMRNAVLRSLDGYFFSSLNKNVTINLYEGSAIGDNSTPVLQIQTTRELIINDYGGGIIGATALNLVGSAIVIINVLAGNGAGIDVSLFSTPNVTVNLFGGGGTPDAVIFDGGAPKNLRSDRPLNQSPIDNLQDGIVNLGSDTTGLTLGVTASFATNLGGDQNIASGQYAVVGGLSCNTGGNASIAIGSSCAALGDQSVAFGSGCVSQNSGDFSVGTNNTASGSPSVALGTSSTASAANSFAMGNTSSASGDSSIAMGNTAIASSDNSIAMGAGASSTHSNSVALGKGAASQAAGELVFADNGITSGKKMLRCTSVGNASATLVDGNGQQWSPKVGITYLVMLKGIYAGASNPGTHGSFQRSITCISNGGSLDIRNQNTDYDFAPDASTLVITAVGHVLHIVFTGNEGNYVTVVEVNWVEAI